MFNGCNMNKDIPAFPFTADCDESKPNQVLNKGMSLRDYFAAHAMKAYINRGYVQDDAARRAYNTAEAMMKEREKYT